MTITTLATTKRHRDYLERKARNLGLFLKKGREATNRWREKNPLFRRESYVQTRYGLSANELTAYAEKMSVEQSNRCAVCGVVGEVIGLVAQSDKIRLVIDHNHETNKLRGLLCDSCNKALGQLKEDKIIIKSLLSYLEKWEGGKKL